VAASGRPAAPTPPSLDDATRLALVEFLQRHGDDRLVLGHRLSEWCGHAPILEEDIALANIALDFVGQASLLLGLAGQLEGNGRDADALAYFRETVEFRNLQIVELPKGDFGFTIVRQFLFDAYDVPFLDALRRSRHPDIAGIAAKAHKEARYHLRHSAEWVVKLGDGTPESHDRAQSALEELWHYTGELFTTDDVDRQLASSNIAPDLGQLEPAWRDRVTAVVRQATLDLPPTHGAMLGGRRGRHTEHLGHMLAEMQIVARSFPGAKW
jgi:ring-1,2-phenylacetyl-CoA epoxidase subunit PaaC